MLMLRAGGGDSRENRDSQERAALGASRVRVRETVVPCRARRLPTGVFCRWQLVCVHFIDQNANPLFIHNLIVLSFWSRVMCTGYIPSNAGFLVIKTVQKLGKYFRMTLTMNSNIVCPKEERGNICSVFTVTLQSFMQ